MADYRTLGISEPLMRVVSQAINNGLALLRTSESLVPVLYCGVPDGEILSIVLVTDTADQAIATGRLVVASGASTLYVLTYSGFVGGGDSPTPRTPAIHVEAYERGKEHGVGLAMRYRPAASQDFGPIGSPIYVGTLPMPAAAAYQPVVDWYERKHQARA